MVVGRGRNLVVTNKGSEGQIFSVPVPFVRLLLVVMPSLLVLQQLWTSLHDADMDLLKKYITYAKLNSFRKYMTFKKDYNELLLYLLNGLVKDALHFKEIVSGSTSGLTHIDVKIEELQHKIKDVCTERCLRDDLSALRS
ncbi:hypothetical protein Ancab_014994 [Ancistrocladus abbreviatus]